MRRAAQLALLLGLAACGGPLGASPGPAVVDDDIMFDDERRAAEERHPASPAVLEGERALTGGRVAEARAHFERAVAEDPRDPRARLDLGVVLDLAGELEGAEQQYRAALEADPDFPEVHNNLGLTLREQGRLDEAVAALERAVALRPGYAQALLNLGLTLEEQGSQAAALEAYRGAVEAAPDEPLARTNLGLLLLDAGARDDARVALRRAYPLAEGQHALLEAIGNGLRRSGDAALAVEALEAAREASEAPSDSLRAELALAQYASGARAEAEATLEALIADSPEYAPARYALGTMRMERGDRAGGRAELRRFLALDPDSPLRPKAEAQLAR